MLGNILKYITETEGNMVEGHSNINLDVVKSNRSFDVYAFKYEEVRLHKHICLSFAILDPSKLFKYETQYDILQPFFDSNPIGNPQLHYMDCDSFVLSIEADKLIRDLTKLHEEKYLLVFNKIDKLYPLHCNKNTDLIGKFKIATPDAIHIDEFFALRSKANAYIKLENVGEKKTQKDNGKC